MGLFTPPESKYSDHYDQSRFNLVWQVAIVFIILMSLVSILNFAYDNYNATPNIIAIGIAMIALFTLKKTGKFKALCYFISISCLLLVSITFFALKNVVHFTTPMWAIMNILFTFFTLGRIWGYGVLIAHFSVIIFYFAFRLEDNINNLPDFTNNDIVNFSIEYSICGLGIAFFIHQFIKTHQYAEGKYKLSNEALNEQNVIISGQNKEKEIMLKEIHHRVKNNLQVITSLLRLQAYDLGEGTISKEFNDAINRVKAMSLIHEKMYQKEMLSNFDLEGYLNSMATDLISTYSLDKQVDLKIESEISNINSKTIVPLALLFNELISNSIKHAFDQIQDPIIKVSVIPKENNLC